MHKISIDTRLNDKVTVLSYSSSRRKMNNEYGAFYKNGIRSLLSCHAFLVNCAAREKKLDQKS